MESQGKTFQAKVGDRPVGTKSQARLDFANRLRELRVPRGFRTARSLAKALDIDENRYTRYERAEVEPDLALIRRICEVLGISPTELLGTGDASATDSRLDDGMRPTGTRSAEPEEGLDQLDTMRHASRDERPGLPFNGNRPIGVEFAAWKLACATAEARIARLDAAADQSAKPGEETESLRVLAIASPLYSRLRDAPFETIAEIASDRSVAAAPPSLATRVANAIEALVGALHDHAVSRSG